MDEFFDSVGNGTGSLTVEKRVPGFLTLMWGWADVGDHGRP